MKFKNLYILLILGILISCEKSKPKAQFVDNFVFSVSAMHSDYSMKFTKSDTVYIERRFPWPTEHFYFIIQENEKNNVLKLASDIKFSKYDSIYDQYLVNHLVDGTGYKFYVEKGNKKNWIYIYGDIGPKEFYAFSVLLNNLKKKQTLHKTTKTVDFGNLNHILLPEQPPPPKLKNSH
jgi:hypothetical protein